MLGILIIVVCIVGLAIVGTAVLGYFSSESRAVRSSSKDSTKQLLTARRQLKVARDSLIKIAANDSGNPSLEANIALEDMSELELKELESKE